MGLEIRLFVQLQLSNSKMNFESLKPENKNETTVLWARDSLKHWPVAVTMKGSWLTHSAVSLVAAVSTVQLVVASLCDWVTHWPACKVTGCHRSLPCYPAGKLVQATTPAALLILPRLWTVPLPITALLLGKAASCCTSTTTLPRRAVRANMERGVEATSLRARKSLVGQWQQASMGFNLDWFVIGGAGDLSKCRKETSCQQMPFKILKHLALIKNVRDLLIRNSQF